MVGLWRVGVRCFLVWVGGKGGRGLVGGEKGGVVREGMDG